MWDKIIFATANQGKMREIKVLLADLSESILSMAEAGVHEEIEESGTTFKENAYLKAQQVWNQCHGIVLADDSGLEVDYLGGQPGVHSSRYLGEDTAYHIKNQAILDQLKGVSKGDRTARFISVIVAILPDGQVFYSEGRMEGLIAEQIAGEGGFGYDPIFFLPTFAKTAAEISLEQKNDISHRGKALSDMKTRLSEWCKGESR